MTDVPVLDLNSDVPVTIIDPVCVIPPPTPEEVRFKVVALTPASTMAESSVTVTVPPVRLREPKFVVSPPLSPSVMLEVPALKVARPAILSVVPLTSVIFPPAVALKEGALILLRVIPAKLVSVRAPSMDRPKACVVRAVLSYKVTLSRIPTPAALNVTVPAKLLLEFPKRID